jgi:hypothetical protein
MREIQSRIPRDEDDSAGLFASTDALVDVLNTIADILRHDLTPVPAPTESRPA